MRRPTWRAPRSTMRRAGSALRWSGSTNGASCGTSPGDRRRSSHSSPSPGRHELTSAGRKWLIAHGGIARVRRSKFPSRMVAATLGVTVLAGAWFSANASYQMFSPPSPAVTGYLALHHLSVRLDPMSARLAHSPADQHPLAMIQSDAPIFAATRRDAGGGTAKLAAAEPSKPLNHATKSTAKPSRKVARVSPRVYPLPQWGNPQWGNDRGSAMAFSDTGRPPRW
jgi:hypothetical protein